MQSHPRRKLARDTRVQAWIPACVAIALTTLASSAHADFHQWEINEIYSNADGTVQFIELYTTEPLQDQLGLTSITSTLVTFDFEFDLSTPETALHYVLIGTQSYTQAPGAITPDYTVADNFFSLEQDLITVLSADAVGFDVGELPVDGDLSIDADLVQASNSPTNFAFDQGHVLLPEANRALLQRASLVLLALLGRGIARKRRAPQSGKVGVPSPAMSSTIRTTWRA